MTFLRSMSSGLLLLTIVTIIYLGLDPKDYRIDRDPITATSKGILFDQYSLLYTEIPFVISRGNINSGYFLRIGLADLKPSTANRFEILFSLESSSNEVILIVGRWNEYLIFREDRNYPNTQQASVYNLSSILEKNRQDEIAIDVHFDKGRSTLLLNNRRHDAVGSTSLEFSSEGTQLFVGGASDKSMTWTGSLLYLEFGNCILDSNTDSVVSSDCTSRNSWVRYDFTKYQQNSFKDLTGNNVDLLPSTAFSLHRINWLSYHTPDGLVSYSNLVDIFLNVAGFIPFGFLLLHFMDKKQEALGLAMWPAKRYLYVAITILAGFMLSIIIETLQIYIPSRVSSLYDLIFNSIGTGIGGIIYYFLIREYHKDSLN